MKKVLKWISLTLGSVLILFVVVILILSSLKTVIFSAFFSLCEESVAIPGLDLPYSAQGLTYSAEQDTFLFCGYMTDKSHSKIFLVRRETGDIKTIHLQKEDGSVYNGHAGGMSVSGNHVFLSNASKIFHLNLQTLLEADDGAYVSFDGSFSVETKASFCFSDDSYLYVGEYYEAGKSAYATKETHHILTASGEQQCALVGAYPLDASSPLGVSQAEPDFYLSIVDCAQGFAVSASGRYIVTTSAGISFSHLYIYPEQSALQSTVSEEVNATIYHLDSAALEEDIPMPPMSEDLTYFDGKVYINFESYAKKYRIFNIWPSKAVYTYPVA